VLNERERVRLLQDELDRRFGETRTLISEYRNDGRRDSGFIQGEMDRRFLDLQLQMDQRFAASDKATGIAMTASEKAVDKAQDASEKRFDGVNEFRKALSDQTATFIPRTEYSSAHDSLTERIGAMNDRLGALELRLTSRLDRGEGAHEGTARQVTETRENKTLANSTMAIVIQSLIGLVAVAALIISVVVTHIH
jgi:hypothetical protein